VQLSSHRAKPQQHKPYPSSTKLHHHRQSYNKGKTPQLSHLIPHRLPQSQKTVQQQQKLQLTTTMPIIKAGRIRSLNHTAEPYQGKSPQPSPTQQTQCKAPEAPGTTPTHPELTMQWQQRGNGLQAIIPAKEGIWCIQTKKQRGQGNTLYPSYHPSLWQMPGELPLSHHSPKTKIHCRPNIPLCLRGAFPEPVRMRSQTKGKYPSLSFRPVLLLSLLEDAYSLQACCSAYPSVD